MTVKIEVDKKAYDRVKRIMKHIPQTLQFAAYDKSLRPAAEIVLKRAQELAPKNNPTQSRKKMSKAARKMWSETPISALLRIKVIRQTRRRPAYALVGPIFPDGNKANFVHPMKSETRERVYWGNRNTKAPSVTQKDQDFLKRAADETRAEQLRAFTRALIPAVRKAMKEWESGN